ncbi:PREDICTED: homeobox-leucine zipper protein HAT3-like isoform X2 [Lupinus angustifolius]|uniref:homeobox-leucine zipper protein HAT3-like isoform X2 n=1 Tax=Lupinus angustifolius TaxID=3871 RepID=UPI00092FCC3A|nr:PREDICTED: homeobox-leucine zipper protein HAT3-like isoform X2 [Lupinus angustifolius]
MDEKNDVLGLSLRLSFGACGMVNLPPSISKVNHNMHKHLHDLSKIPATDCVNDNGVSSPNSTLSSLSVCKQSERDDNEAVVRASCSQGSDDEDGGGDGDGTRKKLRLTKEQAYVLEETFKEHNTLNPKQKQTLAMELSLRPRQVEVWFQNRRARNKLKQTEVDCESLKRCSKNLTEENKRLQKEVQELRALKLSPHLYMHMNPPTTLTMCPSCERVAISSASSSSSTTSQSIVASSNHNPLDLTLRLGAGGACQT